MRTSVKLTMLTMLIALFSQSKAEQVIGLNFAESAVYELAGKTADGCSNWIDGGLNGTGVLTGSNGLVSCEWDAEGWWHAGNYDTPDEQLYYSYFDDAGSNGPLITISGLNAWMASEGYASYVIRVYHNTNSSSGNATFSPVYVYEGTMTLRQDGDNDGEINDYLSMVTADNMWVENGSTRAFVDTDELSSDIVTVDTGWRNTGADRRSNVAAIKITGVDSFVARAPSPSVGQEVSADATLSWEQLDQVAGLGVIYDVYFGTEPNELRPDYYGLNSVKTTTDSPADFIYVPGSELLSETTYYWRVDALEPDSSNPGAYIVHPGNEWSFVTEPASVRIDANPEDQTVYPGSTATLTVDALNATKYQWFKNGVALADDETDTLYIGENSSELTILDFQFDDEGLYHCEADNILNQPEVSSQAYILLARQVGWWKFDSDLTDSIGDLYAGAESHDISTANSDPNLIENGVSGGAYELFGTEGNHLVISNSNEFFNFYPNGYTISIWVNKDIKTGSNWETYISKQADGEGFGLFNQSGGAPVMVQRNSVGDLYSNADIDDNQWHLVSYTYDNDTKTGKIYIDGSLKNSAQGTESPEANSAAVILGLEYADNPTRNLFTGKLDDLRIWSYPLDAFEIGALYTDMVPGSEICVEYPLYDIAGPDGVGEEYRDCKVDMFDFIPIAQSWLQCNIVPDCMQ